jgi:hypothetical protein
MARKETREETFLNKKESYFDPLSSWHKLSLQIDTKMLVVISLNRLEVNTK